MARVAIATPSLNAYSETFVRAHSERLPADTVVLYGGIPPTLFGEGKPIVPSFTVARHLRWAIQRRLRRLSWEDRCTDYLVRCLQHLKADVVLAEYGHMGVALMEACAQAEVPLVVHFHGYDAFAQDVVERYGKDYGRLFIVSAGLVANSNSMRSRLISLGAPEQLIHINPMGVDTSQFHPTLPDANPPIMLAVGRFVNKKAPYLTLLAFHQASQVVPELRLVMVGDGPLLEVCIRLAERLHIAGKVEFAGVCEPTEVAKLMREARGFAQHSVVGLDGDSESFGIVFIEAGASGLPVIGTRHDGIPEVVVDGETGFLVDEGDVDGMAEAMVRLARDPQLAARMGQAGRERVEHHFSMEKSINGLWHILEAAIRATK